MPVKHAFVSAKSDGGDTTLVRPVDWNADHTGSNLEVKEIDGAPDVTGVSIIQVTNGKLTDNGGGNVSLDLSGGAGLTIQEADGSPSLTAATLVVPNRILKSASTTATLYDYDTIVGNLTGLVHRWKFDEASGNFADSVGSLTLAASGSVSYHQAGPLGATSATKLASGAHATSSGLGSIPTGAGAATFVAVFRTDGVNVTGNAVFWVGGFSTRLARFLKINDNGSGGSAAFQDGTDTYGDDYLWANSGLGDGQWHLSAWGYDGGRNLYAYKDGEMRVKYIGAALNTSNTGNLTLPQDTFALYLDDFLVTSTWLGKGVLDDLWMAARQGI